MACVSVIIPCYNRERLLCETLDSLRAQTYPDWEGIVVDDHSQDGSAEVARRYARQDGRFRAVSRQGDRKGANVCRNQGLTLAQGNYVIILDSDDLLSPTCLEHRVAAMDRAPDSGFGVYQTELFTQAIGDRQLLWNAFTASSDLHRFLSLDTVWLTTASIWRKETLMQLGGFDEEVLSFQDWDIHVQALIAGIKYFKENVRDNFHRYDYDRVNTISGIKDFHPDHLRSCERLFAKTFHSVDSAGLLNDEVRCRLAGAYWWLAERWHAVSCASAAGSVWHQALDLGLCNHRQYLEGRLILRLYKVRGGHRLSRLIQRSWPIQFRRVFSEQLTGTPISHAQPEGLTPSIE